METVHTMLMARFNRYIVECKCGTAKLKELTADRFNRYIVECKSTTISKDIYNFHDLIDT